MVESHGNQGGARVVYASAVEVEREMPEHIGNWRVLRTLARGGMATVYAVADPESGESFAIKLLTQPGASQARLVQEYRALARIDHPNIVRVFRYGSTPEGQAYVLMELLDGVAAQVRAKATGRPGEPARTAEAARIAMHVAVALGHLHARGIVHRDLKSSNVVVMPNGTVKLLDFGTARLLDAWEPITQLGEFVGTFAYASPEQLTGGAVDARSDLYSLGVLLFRMLCGRRPFEADNPHELARLHLDQRPPDPQVLVPSLSSELSQLVLRLLAKLPADRPADARRVAEQLATFAADGGQRRGVGPAPFLGRDRAFAAAQRFLAEATPGSALWVAGEVGSGRRAFIELVAEEASRRGARVLPLAGDDDAFRRLVWLVRDTRSELDGDGIDDDPATASPSPDTIEHVAELLAVRARAENRAAVLAAPAFWSQAGPTQSAVMEVLEAARGKGAPVVLVAGVDAEAVPEDEPSTRVDLRPLAGAEVAAIAAHWLGVASIPPELARRLLRASGGLPGPLTELVRALPGADAHTPLRIPSALRDDALLRLEALARSDLRLVEAVALAERELDAVRVAAMLDRDPAEVERELDRLEARGILLRAGGFWQLRQGILAELVRDRTHPARRHLYCRRLRALASDLPASEALADAVRLAGEPTAAAEIAVRWAWPLVRAGGHAEVLPLLERVADAMPVLEGTTGVRFWTLLAECLAELQVDDARANVAVSRASSLVRDGADAADVELAASRLARARADSGAERSLLRTALERLSDGDEDGRTAEGRAHMADLLVRAGELPAAVSEAGLALRAAGGDVVRYATTLGYTQLAAGQIGQAELTFRSAEARARAEGRTAWRALSGLVVVLVTQGRYSEAAEIGDAAERDARAGAPGDRLAGLQLALAELDLALFRQGVARSRIDQALDALRGEVPPRLEVRLALVRTRLAWEAGDLDAAVDIAEDALRSPGVAAARAGAAEVRGVRGVLLCSQGRPDVGWIDLAAAVSELVEMGGLPALARVAEMATLCIDDAAIVEPLWTPLSGWIDEEQARPARLARAVNRLRYVRNRGWNDADEAQAVYGAWSDLVAQLVPNDASAMMVHPWARLGARL